MKPYFEDNLVTLYNKDCRAMSELPDNSVQCVVTSPPYWGLRKYSGLQDLIWGGSENCEHEWGELLERYIDKRTPEQLAIKSGLNRNKNPNESHVFVPHSSEAHQGNFCSLCGAWKGQYGLEPTPEMYIEHTIEILREIRRVLRKDGVVFWNIGDSYAGSSTVGRNDLERKYPTAVGKGIDGYQGTRQLGVGMKPKDLCLIPFRVAIAAQEDGWWVRSIIIWSKPNPMPESVTDRPTESHEYILMLTKSGTSQYWTHRDHEGTRSQPEPDYRWIHKGTRQEVSIEPDGWTPKNKMDWDRINLWRGHDYYWDADAVREEHKRDFSNEGGGWTNGKYKPGDNTAWKNDPLSLRGADQTFYYNPAGRNIRSVWEFPTQPYPEAHFAVFPEKLPEICIKAATPEVGCCSKCGAPWERITSRESYGKEGWAPAKKDHTKELQGSQSFNREEGLGACGFVGVKTLGWQPTCKCNADKVPSIVLDPFMGSGTVMWVAKILGRRGVGYELSEEYCQLALERNRQSVMELKV